jgi:hypothetical protein
MNTGAARPVAVHTPDEGSTIGGDVYTLKSESNNLQFNLAPKNRQFAFLNVASLTFAERFPRLTIAMIAVTLLVLSVNVEIECFRGAGFHWN